MQINLLEAIPEDSATDIPKWQDILNEVYNHDIPGQTRTQARQSFVDTHATTLRRVAIGDYHYHNLNQIYVPNVTLGESLTTSWTEAEMESIFFILFSALDSLAQEINLTYKFGIDDRSVHIHHSTVSHPSKNCVRCKLDGINDDLGKYLNTELSSDWFKMFHKLRNHITHRSLPVTNTYIDMSSPYTYIEMPIDPTSKFPITPGNKQGIEVNAYCQQCRKNVAGVINSAYELLLPKIGSL